MKNVTQILKRDDGSEVRIVATPFDVIGDEVYVDVYVHHRKSPDEPWKLANDRPHPDWRKMSVSEYTRRGRAEIYQDASIGEILKARAAARELGLKSEGLFIVE